MPSFATDPSDDDDRYEPEKLEPAAPPEAKLGTDADPPALPEKPKSHPGPGTIRRTPVKKYIVSDGTPSFWQFVNRHGAPPPTPKDIDEAAEAAKALAAGQEHSVFDAEAEWMTSRAAVA